MLVQAVILYLKFVKVFDVKSSRFSLKSSLPTWRKHLKRLADSYNWTICSKHLHNFVQLSQGKIVTNWWVSSRWNVWWSLSENNNGVLDNNSNLLLKELIFRQCRKHLFENAHEVYCLVFAVAPGFVVAVVASTDDHRLSISKDGTAWVYWLVTKVTVFNAIDELHHCNLSIIIYK